MFTTLKLAPNIIELVINSENPAVGSRLLARYRRHRIFGEERLRKTG